MRFGNVCKILEILEMDNTANNFVVLTDPDLQGKEIYQPFQ